MLKYSLLIFDLDGTTADTDRMIVETAYEMFQRFDPLRGVEKEKLIYFSGPPINETLRKEFPSFDEAELMANFNEIMKVNFDKYCVLFPHELKVLLALKKEGYKLALVTNKGKILGYTLKHLGIDQIFDVVVGFNDVKVGKPDPEGVNFVLRKLNVLPSKTLYIGDTYYDYLTAKNAGVDFGLVDFVRKDLKDAKPKYIFKDFLDMNTKLNSLK